MMIQASCIVHVSTYLYTCDSICVYNRHAHELVTPHGDSQSLKINALIFLPDPGDLNFQRDAFPVRNAGVSMTYYVFVDLEIWDSRPSI